MLETLGILFLLGWVTLVVSLLVSGAMRLMNEQEENRNNTGDWWLK